jgi:hypothetical protein
MPSEEDGAWFDARYVYFSMFHRHKIVNGYSGFFPPSYADLISRERDFPSDASLQYLRTRGVEYVSIHGAFYDRDRYRSIVGELDRRTDMRLVAAAPWQGSESRLYRLDR